MLKPELLDPHSPENYFFCSSPECAVVYFSVETNRVFRKEDLRLRVGIKEHDDPIPVCYCFGFNESDLRSEIMHSGKTSIPDRIRALIQQGFCACEERNPSGKCCLGEVQQRVQSLVRAYRIGPH